MCSDHYMDKIVIPRLEGIVTRLGIIQEDLETLKKRVADMENVLLDTTTMAKSWREIASLEGGKDELPD